MDLNGKTIKTAQSVTTESSFTFAKHTTYGCGGAAKLAYFPKSIRQAAAVYDLLKYDKTEFVTLGNGSNVLASDKFFDGAVVCMKNLKGIYRTGKNTFFCRAGTTVSEILKFCVNYGFGGLEFLAGIPATCGGLVCMNAGADGKSVGGKVVHVKYYDGKMRRLSNKNCKFGQKYSIMRDRDGLILGAEFACALKDGGEVELAVADYLEKRKSQPKGKSCGCVFKNAENVSAGKLIDEAGLKGLSFGGAEVSGKHANFIVNNGGSSADIYALICEVKRKVYARTGVLLEEEVVYIGDFNDSFG